jgi:hypothetical protein
MWRIKRLSKSISTLIDNHLDSLRQNCIVTRTKLSQQELDNFTFFVTELTKYVLRGTVPDPPPELVPIYQPLVGPSLNDYRLFNRKEWNAYFLLNQQNSTMWVEFIQRRVFSPSIDLGDLINGRLGA